jgi:transposase
MLRAIRTVVDLYALEHPGPARSPSPEGGRPRVPRGDLLKVLLLQAYRTTANRPAEGDPHALEGVLDLSREFSYKTIERAYSQPDVLEALHAILEITNRPVGGLEQTFAADGSGFSMSVIQHYRSARERQRRTALEIPPPNEHGWVFNLANVGIRFGLIAGWTSWVDRGGKEVAHFPGVFAQTHARHPTMQVQLGDGAYSARWVVAMAAEVGVSCRFLPRRDVTFMGRGASMAWGQSLLQLLKDPQGWLSDYHERSKVEVGWSALKSRHPGKIRKRKVERQVTEATLRAVAYNLRRLCYLRWLEEDPRFTEFARWAG